MGKVLSVFQMLIQSFFHVYYSRVCETMQTNFNQYDKKKIAQRYCQLFAARIEWVEARDNIG